MEAINLMELISRLMRLNKTVKEAEATQIKNYQTEAIIKDFLLEEDGYKKTNYIPATRMLALEQIRHSN